MKRILFMLTMLSVMSLTCAADYTYPYITFVKADGQSLTFSASGITMTPQSGVLTVNSDSGTETFTISELSKMYFSQDHYRCQRCGKHQRQGTTIYRKRTIHRAVCQC